MERYCDICGKLLKKDQSKTCSYECRNKYISKIRKEEGQERICLVCDTIFTVKKKSSKKECCSRSCAVTLGHQRQESLFQSRMEETKTCIVCGNTLYRNRHDTDKRWSGRHICSKKCVMVHVHNDPLRMNKIRKTNQEKYGVNYTTQDISIQNKIKSSLYNKYGVDNPSRIPEVRQKIREYTIERVIKNNGNCFPNYSSRACSIFEQLDKKFGFISSKDSFFAESGGGEYRIPQYGYFLDYINFKLKVIIEWEDRTHYENDSKRTKKSQLREQEIKYQAMKDYIYLSIDDRKSDEEIINKLSRIFMRITKKGLKKSL